MNMHVAPVMPAESFTFAINDIVDHRDGGMRSVVCERTRASNGLEIYAVLAVDEADPQRSRIIMGDVLVLAS